MTGVQTCALPILFVVDMTQRIYVRPQLNRILYGLLGDWKLVDRWWHSSNKGFDGKAPNEVYWSGEQGRQDVAAYILKHTDTQG